MSFNPLRYVVNTLLGLDQFANTIIGGDPDETISARAGRLRNRPGWKQLAWTLDKIEKNHTVNAIMHERDGSQQNEAYRDVYDPEDLNKGK